MYLKIIFFNYFLLLIGKLSKENEYLESLGFLIIGRTENCKDQETAVKVFVCRKKEVLVYIKVLN